MVNLRNDGTLPFLPDDAVIEVPGPRRPRPVRLRCPSTPLEPLYAGLIAHVTAYEHLALDAALHGGRTGSSRRCSPTRWSARSICADGLTDRLLAHNREHLPWA